MKLFPLARGPLPDATGRVGGWNITSYFGGRIDPITGRPGNHGGEDISGPGYAGQPLYAVDDGVVSQSWDASGGGNWTNLTTSDGRRYGYGHAASFAPGVNGQRVTAGTILAYGGTTGASTGPHLHFAFAPRGGAYADPYDELKTAADWGAYPGGSAPIAPSLPTQGFGTMTDDQINAKFAELAQNILILEMKIKEDVQAGELKLALNTISTLGAKLDQIIAKLG